MLDGLSKAGVRAGRHHDTKRKDGMGGFGTQHGHSHGGHQQGLGQIPIVGGYVQQAQNTFQHATNMIPGHHGGGGGHSGGGIGGFVQQAQGMLGGGGHSGGGVGSYISQAQHMLGGQGGSGGIGGFMQNLAGGGGRRREINDDDDERGVREQGTLQSERGEKVDDLDEERDRERVRYPEPQQPTSGDFGRSNPPYPRTPPVPENDEARQGGYPYGSQTPYNGQVPYGGQPPYDGRRY